MRPPPPAALAQVRPNRSDSTLSLLSLATTICRLAARIESIDAHPSGYAAAAGRVLPAHRSIGTSDIAHRHSLSIRRSRVGSATVLPRDAALQREPVGFRKLSSPRLPPTLVLSQSRSNSTAAARRDEKRTSTDHYVPAAFEPSSPKHPFEAPPIGHSMRASGRDDQADSSASRLDSDRAHWQAPWQSRSTAQSSQGTGTDEDLEKHFSDLLLTDSARFSKMLNEDGLNGYDARRISAHRLWRSYQQHAHKEALPAQTRVEVARSLARTVHLVSTNQFSHTKKALRFLFSKRIRALHQDCITFLEKTRQPPLSSPRQGRLRFSIRMLEAIWLALDAKPVAALETMDAVLRECRPDIYERKQASDDLARDQFSLIGLALTTIIDSLSFEMRCQNDVNGLKSRIQLRRSYYDDQGMLDGILNGQLDPNESDQPLKEFLKWYASSMHAFLFSHPSFRHARSNLLSCLCHAPDANQLVEQLSEDFDVTDQGFASACEMLLRSKLIYQGPSAALELYEELWTLDVPLSSAILGRLVKDSNGEDPSARLEALLHRVSFHNKLKVRTNLLRSIALRWAMRNRADRFRPILMHLDDRRNKSNAKFKLRVYRQLFAARGDIKSLIANLAETHDFKSRLRDKCQPGKLPLGPREFALLLRACNRSNDIDSAEQFLAEAVDRGLQMRSSDYNLLIDTYVRRLDIDAALSIFEQMKSHGIQPDKYTYTILINGFALRHDPDAAAHTLRAMVAAGLTPDRVTYAALLDCYVESGVYGAAIRLFGWMQGRRDNRLRPSIEVCNIILKAYVLSSLPVQRVMKFVDSVRRAGLMLNANTYALMLQSACDAGLMHIAEEVFSEAESVLPNPVEGGVGQGANLFHFTIMIHGYLRLGEQQEAKEYFDEMQRRKLHPSAVTWSVMVHSYARSENDVNYNLASTLVSQLVSDENKQAFKPFFLSDSQASAEAVSRFKKSDEAVSASRKSPSFDVLYTVLMSSQARRGEPELVEKTLERLVSSTSGLSVYNMTPLLDAYRRVGDVDSALLVFEQIYRLGLEATSVSRHRVYAHSPPGNKPEAPQSGQDSATEKIATRRQDASSRSILCLPISIMIDVLSAAGKHEEIARIWTRAKQDGFGFDSANWNHLAASMASAGQLEEALSVVEHVLYNEPPRSWALERASPDMKAYHAKMATESAEAERKSQDEVDEASDVPKEDDGVDMDAHYDPYLTEAEIDPAAAHRSDATGAPQRPPNRRYEMRTSDDPHTDLPFERRQSTISDAEEETKADETGDDYAEPSAFYLDEKSGLPDVRELVDSELARFSPWYAHFGTMEAISRELAELNEADKVIALLDRFPTAASLIDRHERKVEIMRERQREEAVRSARNLIDGRS